MTRKCSIFGCSSKYDSKKGSDNDVSVYYFPTDPKQCKKWVDSIPRHSWRHNDVTRHMGVCSLHWPSNVPLIRKSRFATPAVPPSVFPCVPPSTLRNVAQPRITQNSTTNARDQCMDIDEMPDFEAADHLCNTPIRSFQEKLYDFLHTSTTHDGLVASDKDQTIVSILSSKRKGPIHAYSIFIRLSVVNNNSIEALHFEGYLGLKSSKHDLYPDGVLKRWSQLAEVIRHFVVKCKESESTPDNVQSFIERQVQLINAPKNGHIYSSSDLIQAFTWYTRSRALYTKLRAHLKLPSLSTLGQITRKSKNTDDLTLFHNIFQSQPDRSKACIILVDEMYVKASVQYCGGELIGFAKDDETKKATTVLAVMVKCLFGGKKFLAKLLPVAALKTDFLFEVVSNVITMLEECGGKVLSIINDNNRVNQAFFKLFTPYNPLSPWIVRSPSDSLQPLFLLYDPTHIVKNIRNNWTTEATKTLSFPLYSSSIGETCLACWSDVNDLYKHEYESMLKLSHLTKSSVWPSNTQKQSVSLALQVFCDETSSALRTSSSSTDSWKSTAAFIQQVVQLWKLLNCKSPFQSTRLNDPDRVVIGDESRVGMETLQRWADIAVTMRPTTAQRKQCLTRDTSQALEWTCKCLLDLCQDLLTTDAPWKHRYVCLGFFQQDDLERHFGHFRLSAGSNYYLSVKEALTTNALDRAKLLLDTTQDLDNTDDRHRCSLCKLPLSDADLLLLDDMAGDDLVLKIPHDEKNAMVYVAGYVAHKNRQDRGLTGTLAESDITSYFTDRNRGGLCCPSEEFVAFLLHCYCFFINSNSKLCRSRLVAIMGRFVDIFDIDIHGSKKALACIANIFLKRFAIKSNSDSKDCRSSRKTTKLSST